MRLIRFTHGDSSEAQWGIVEGDTVTLITNAATVEELHLRARENSLARGKTMPLSGCRPLPPVTGRVQAYCAGLNYRDHAAEVRMPLPKSPIFFTKPGTSLCGARDDIIRPRGVALLDYEIELAVVVGKRIGRDDDVNGDNLGEYLLGISIFNDVSARDAQLAAGQWFLGKSYRTFAPLGPVVQVIDDDVRARLYTLDLSLAVRDARGGNPCGKGQSGSTGDMVFRIHELLRALLERTDLLPGDVIATGTPAGVALRSPGKFKTRMAEILGIAPGRRIAMFLEGERRGNRRYLDIGDGMELSIRSADGKVDLGQQYCAVVADTGSGA